MKFNMLFVISTVNYGGAGKMICFLANHLSRSGHNVTIYTYAGNNIHYSLDQNVHYIPEYNIYKNTIAKRLMPIFQVRKTIAKSRPDLIISFLNNANFISILGAAFKNIPVIINERSDPYNEKNMSLSLMRSFYKFAEGAVFQTEGAKSYYNKLVQKKSEVIPNPVTFNSESRIPLDRRRNEIAFVGRFNIKQKRQDLMINAFSKVVKTRPEMKLVFYGDGPDMQKIKELATEINISEKVIFAGKVNNVQEKLRGSRLFVLASDYEGIPNALIEAMSVGIPVVATDCSPGGARLLVQDKENGLLVPTDDVDKLASAILYLLHNPMIAEQYGSKAQDIIKKYNPEKIMKMWSQFIEKVSNRNK